MPMESKPNLGRTTLSPTEMRITIYSASIVSLVDLENDFYISVYRAGARYCAKPIPTSYTPARFTVQERDKLDKTTQTEPT